MSKPRKAAKRLSTTEANRRLISIVSFLEPEVRVAVEMKAVLQSWSAEVERQGADERRFYNVPMINFAGDAIAHQLAITLARLFDRGSKRFHDNYKDIASIPLALRLLRQTRCRNIPIPSRPPAAGKAPAEQRVARHPRFRIAPLASSLISIRFPLFCLIKGDRHDAGSS
jgi:hypothetical protein